MCFSVICAVALLLLFPVSVLSFGHDGHQIVADVAHAQQNSKHARASLKYILDGKSLSDVANWADDVVKNWSWSAGLHFVNIVQEPCTVDTGCEFVYERDCPESRCVAGAILNYTAQLQALSGGTADAHSGNSTIEEAIALNSTAADEALRFVIHFLGDLHQPLHVARDSDRGGTMTDVLFYVPGQGTEWNLHSVWDFGMLVRSINETYMGQQSLFTAEILRLLETEWKGEVEDWLQCPGEAGHVRDVFVPFEKIPKPSAVGSGGAGAGAGGAVGGVSLEQLRACVVAWGQESVDDAVTLAYLNEHGEEIQDGDSLSNDYWQLRMPTVQRRIAMAGVRLAAVLDGLLG